MVRRLLVPVALLGLLVFAGLALAPIYRGPLLPQLLAAAAAGPVLISVAVRRMPGWTAAPLSVLGLAGLTLLAVRVSARAAGVSGALPELARDALRNSIPRLITALIPIEPQPDTVVLPVIATWLAGLAAAELGVRYQRVLLSYAPPTVLLGGALYLVGRQAEVPSWVPVGYAAFAALGLAASSREPLPDDEQRAPLTRDQRRSLRLRVGAGALVGLAVIVGLSQTLGSTVAANVGTQPADPRAIVTPPQLDSLDENPLVRLSGWNLNHDQRLFDVRIESGSDTQRRLRLAVLSDYDGVTWRVGATYRSAGRVVDADPDPAGTPVRQTVRITGLDGRLLPAIARPERVDQVRVAIDRDTGTMIDLDGLRDGLTYTVSSRVVTPDYNAAQVDTVRNDDSVARYLELPGKVPDSINQLNQYLSSGVAAPYEKAIRIQDFLAEHYRLVSDAPSGHAYPNVEYFLFGPKQAGGQKGTSEQFTAAFAVLARLMGLPTRVVVGFAVREGDNTVRGGDAVAWPEVRFDTLGWVPFDPLPKGDTVQRPVEDDFRPKPPPSQPPPQPVPTPSTSVSAKPSASPSAPASAPAAGGPDGRLVAAGAAGTLLALLVVFFAGVPLVLRQRRRRRLDHGPPAARIDAAWSEVLIGLRQAGRPVPAHLSASEIARHAASAANGRAYSRRGSRAGVLRSATPPIDDLAYLVNVVAFAGPQTVRGLPAGPGEAQAQRAAAQARAYLGELRARRGRWRRLLWTFDPRPLFWRR